MNPAEWARRALWLGTAVVALHAGFAQAGSFQVNPIRVDLTPKAQTTALSVRNTGTDPVVVQVSVDAWAQEDGKDVYSHTREIIATPPVLTIPPDQERIVRIGLRRAPDKGRELSYRLFLQEVPPPPQPGFQGIVVALRVGLPVFVAPAQGSAAPRLAWKATRLPDNQLEISAANEGNGHIQISDLSVSDGKADVATYSGLSYVLPDQRRNWSLPLTTTLGASRIRLKAVTDAGNIDADIDLAN